MATGESLPPPPASPPPVEIDPAAPVEQGLVTTAMPREPEPEPEREAFCHPTRRWCACLSRWMCRCRCGTSECAASSPLSPGQVIETQWAHGEDMPLAAGAVQLAWSEFEVIDAELAVRITRLA